MNKKGVYWGVFFIALTTLIWEILLTRIFSATMYYHFVFISISLAMLGFGCSGLSVFLFPGFFSKEKCADHLTLFSALFSVSMVLAIVIYLQVDSALNPSFSTFLVLIRILFFIFLPYLFSGFTITLALKHYSKNVAVLYCYDLVGAGLGCIFAILLLFVYDGISLVILAASFAAFSSLIFSRNSSRGVLKKASAALFSLALIFFVCNAYVYRFLKIQYVLGKPQTEIIFEKWNPINRVTVTPDKEVGGQKTLLIDYDSSACSTMIAFDGDRKKAGFLNSHIKSFYYQIVNPDADVLIIGIGGGQDVLNSYVNGIKRVTAVEINPVIAKLNTDVLREFNGNLFSRAGITLHIDEGRSFIRHTGEKYDCIHLGNVDSGSASAAGAYTFSENTLYTVEAFKDYHAHLKDQGVVWVTRWRAMQKNYFLEDFRVLSSMVRCLEELGMQHPERHVVVIGEKYRPGVWLQVLLLMKKSPFLPQEIQSIDAVRARMDLEWLHHPEKRLNNVLDDYLFSADRETFLRDYPLRVDPTTDNNPFFFNFLKPTHYFWKLPSIQTHFTYPVFMFKSLFLITFLMIIISIFLPLLWFRKKVSPHVPAPLRGYYLFYFSCLGLGFMLVEIPLIQKFILLLGQPLYSISVILAALLISSGVGSMLSGRISEKAGPSALRSVICIICTLLIITIYGLPVLFDACLGMSTAIRILIAIIVVLPLGILMGMTLPLGIRLLEQEIPSMIPWVWSLNGACSVMGSIAAWGLSLNYGYHATLWTAVIVYGCACISMILKSLAVRQQEQIVLSARNS